MSLEEALAANTAALERNSALLERVVAGQEAAFAKLESGGTTTRRRSSKATAEPAAADTASDSGDSGNSPSTSGNEAAAADTASPAPAAETASEAAPAATTPVIQPILDGIGNDADKLKAHIQGWTGGTEDADERAKRVQLLKDIAASLGVAPKFSDLIPVALKAVFLIERARAGGIAAVDVKADYDFNGDPAQGLEAKSTSSESDFD